MFDKHCPKQVKTILSIAVINDNDTCNNWVVLAITVRMYTLKKTNACINISTTR